jgi:hypothetical protein
MNTHLKQDSSPVSDTADPPIEPRLLRVFPEDSGLPGDSKNATIDEVFIERPRFEPPAPAHDRGPFDDWKRGRLAAIRAASFPEFPAQVPAARAKPSEGAEPGIQWVESEPGIEVALLDLRKATGRSDRCTLIVLNEGDVLEGIPSWARSIVAGDQVVVLAPRGVGPTSYTKKNPPNYVERAHALVGRTIDQGRIWDVIATRGWISSIADAPVRFRLAGKGSAGIIAAYASLLGFRDDEVVALEPPTSHRQGPILLNIMRILDVPEALGLLAPARLTLIKARPESFVPTAQLYDRAGAMTSLIFE